MKTDKRQQAWLRKQTEMPKPSILNIKCSGNPIAIEQFIDKPDALKEAYEFRKNKKVFDPVIHELMKKIGYN